MTLFFTEMWERFSYYGMRALLTVFMVTPIAAGGLEYSNKKAGLIYGTYTMSVYMLSIPGGFIADNFLGSRMSVLYGGIIIAAGHFSLAFQSQTMFFAGLVMIALGTGLLKPNISAMVGSLYTTNDERRDAGFSIFYMGINLGAFISPLITGYLAQSGGWRERLSGWGMDPNHSWHWGFAAAGVGMTIGLFTYFLNNKGIQHVGNPPPDSAPRPWKKLGIVILGTVGFYGIVRLSDQDGYNWLRSIFLVLPIGTILWLVIRGDINSQRMAAILIFSVAVMIFWAVFEQAGSTIALFSEQLTDRTLPNNGNINLFGLNLGLSSPFPSAWFQSVNSLFVITLAPLFAWIWVKLGSKQPSSPVKFALGLVFLVLSFVLMVPAARLTAHGLVSPFWIVGLFLLQTIGELCISPVGLSTLTKLSTPNLVGFVMGIWFLAAALGNKLAGVLGGDFDAKDPSALAHFFSQQAIWVTGFTIVLLALVPWIRKLMCGVR